ncbi:nuclear transport factor 2 family protein [Shewanella waksmanii]|uniref:nuclear transport factor 2 family protein n=1 Tax=Shewanella waksmanii TaxID=213783 RepID=UPI003735E295
MKLSWMIASLSLLAASVSANESAEQTVRAFINSYNQHSVEQMLQYTTEDVRWMNITGTKVVTETGNQAEFAAAMADYFETLQDAHAVIVDLLVSGPYVSTVEQVTWQHEGEQHSQCAIGNFRVRNGKIVDLWYLPAHACDEVVTPVEPEIGMPQHTQQ